VLIQPPVYNIFWNSIINNGRNVVTNELLYDGRGYSIDFGDLDKKLANPQTTMMILCNPQNPAGRIWSREELMQIGELARRHHVVIVSDEIHCDIVRPGRHYTPFASVSNDDAANCVVCVSPSKAFNIAGMQTAAVIVPDAVLRHKVTRGLNTDEVAEPNAFAIDAAVAAYTQGETWLDELCAYVQANKDYAAAFINENIPRLTVPDSDATYLLWIDVSGLGDGAIGFAERLRAETGLFLSDGAVYGDNGRGFVRMNLACPLETVKDGLNRLKEGAQRII
jgi:cystathionine beta-lyase